ncbi:probable bifunctional methylthioribulose-1-phosphate dehydratase/enolase-phosphatase E1 [Lolium perenne]|uniref:probable bifunctional methylthioribulose-1-phosphate dehydratase/enolase-phosphatase E1 n=1 Tax=Lolium perenne TaxID=4522 RepID=UPI003A98D040
MYQLGIDWTTPEHGPINSAKRLCTVISPDVPNGAHAAKSSKHCVVLDIEGTTTPISFVTDVMFPYARDNVRKHLISTYDSEETKEDIELLRIQVEEDLRNGVVGAVPVAPSDASKEEVINSLVTNVESMIKADRKITSLKQLQVYIYSSGSREAQRLLFGHSSHGDLRQYLCGFFDTTTGNKREARSYFEISKSLGVDNPSEILFITDVFEEAVAAKSAGLDVIISIRPGNAPLPENHGFRTISSFSEI